MPVGNSNDQRKQSDRIDNPRRAMSAFDRAEADVYSTAGAYTYFIPLGVRRIFVEVFGGGSASAGGGYGADYFEVVSGQQFTVTVGSTSAMSSFGSLISATGASGSTPGTSAARINVDGGGSGLNQAGRVVIHW